MEVKVFRVSVTETRHHYYDIEASSEQDAERIYWKMTSTDKEKLDGDGSSFHAVWDIQEVC